MPRPARGANNEYERKGLECKNKVCSRFVRQERRRPATGVAEYEGSTRPGRRFKGQDGYCSTQEDLLEQGDIQQDARDAELDHAPVRTPVYLTPLLFSLMIQAIPVNTARPSIA